MADLMASSPNKGGGLAWAARFVLALWLAWVCAGAGLAAAAADDAASLLERRIKAAILYRFINYVDWPDSAFASPASPFTIAIVGADDLGAELSEFAAGRSVLNRPLTVRRLRGPESAKDAHIVFVGKEDAAQFAAIVRALPPGALVVTEWNDALKHGAVINFLNVEGQVRFEISLEAAQRRNLRLSARLLSVAIAVR
jgi:hypothetical protein